MDYAAAQLQGLSRPQQEALVRRRPEYAEQLPAADVRLVRHALSLAIGSQSMVALLDTAGLDPDEARTVTQFVCRAIASETQRLVDEHDPSNGERAAAATG